MVPMPRVQGQRIAGLGCGSVAPEDRLPSFRLSLRRLIFLMFKILLGHNVFMLYFLDYGLWPIWKPTFANINSVNDEPRKICNSQFP